MVPHCDTALSIDVHMAPQCDTALSTDVQMAPHCDTALSIDVQMAPQARAIQMTCWLRCLQVFQRLDQ